MTEGMWRGEVSGAYESKSGKWRQGIWNWNGSGENEKSEHKSKSKECLKKIQWLTSLLQVIG